ncbi:MAG: putative transposase [Egibacteraceae bacterium]
MIVTSAGRGVGDVGDDARMAGGEAADVDGVDGEDSPGLAATPAGHAQEAVLTPPARPVARTAERRAARAGLLAEAGPVIAQGAGLPLAGALVVLPALAATGLLEAAEQTYGRAKAALDGLRSLLLTMVFAMLIGQPRAEGLRRIDPADLGRLIGLDRAPEPKTLGRRVGELAAQGKAG